MSDTDGRAGESRRKASYAEAAARPPPIDTTVARANTATDLATASTGAASSAGASTAASSFSSPWTAGSVPDYIQSAKIPKKVSWDTTVKSTQTSRCPVATSENAPRSTTKANVGLGIDTTYQYPQGSITESSTSPYHYQASDSTANSFPLIQYPWGSARAFADQHRILPDSLLSPPLPSAETSYNAPVGSGRKNFTTNARNVSYDTASDVTDPFATSDLPSRPDSVVDSALSVGLGSGGTGPSDLTEFEGQEIGAVAGFEWIEQRNHPKSFRSKARYQPHDIKEAFFSAWYTLKALNSERMKLPSNARVICIKSEFVANIHTALQISSWAAMEKVGMRINRLWDARTSKDDKVFLMFSVNGYKSYCGLAEMSGPFHLGGVNLEAWDRGGDGSTQWGTIPITWLYVKNVAYGWFNHIHHDHNDGAITNMWNGMHFPTEAGRAVVRTFIERPHFTNMMCWDKKGPYIPFKVPQAWQLDPDFTSNAPRNQQDNDRRGKKGCREDGQQGQQQIEDGRTFINRPDADRASDAPETSRKAVPTAPWHSRKTNDEAGRVIGEVQEGQPTPMRTFYNKQHTPQVHVTPPIFDGPASPAPRPGQILHVSVVVDEHGHFVPVTPGGHHLSGMSIHSPGFAPGYNQGPPQQYYSPQHAPFGGMQSRPSNPGYLGSTYTPKYDNRFFSGPMNSPGPRSPMAPQTVRNMQSESHLTDVFATPGHHHPGAAMSRMASPVIIGNPPKSKKRGNNVENFKRAAGSANFVPQATGSASSYAPSADTGSHAAATPFSYNDYATSSVAGSDPEKFVEAKQKELLETSRRMINIENELAQHRYKNDPRATKDHDHERYEGDEPQGVHAWVSTSSLEKDNISPVSSWKGGSSVVGSEINSEHSEMEHRLAQDVDRLVASPKSSINGAKSTDGGVRLQ